MIPTTVQKAADKLKNSGFQAYLVGGCTRDLIMNRNPKDWDIATDATPEDIQRLFQKNFYNNKYGTVTVVDEEIKDETLKNIEITPFRIEGGYTDLRHPSMVRFAKTIDEDLKRRDFTMNAIALDPFQKTFIDPFNGQKDIKDRVIRAVGLPAERFQEDALRLMRAVRFATELEFSIEKSTKEAISENAALIQEISFERIRDELSKIILSKNPRTGLETMEEVGLLKYAIPELREGIGVSQNQAHAYEVFEHNLRCVQHAANRNFSFHVRLAALFHDVAKPKTRAWGDKKKDWTFYGHDVVGGHMTKKALERLKFSRETVEVVSKLVRYHLFFSDPDKITMSAVRRLVRNVGKEHIWELMNVRACDRIGTGRPKEAPYRLRKYESMIEEAMREPLTVGMLKINGGRLMEVTSLKPGPEIGLILHALLNEVLDDPLKNTADYLEKRAVELSKLPNTELKKLGDLGKEKKEGVENEAVGEIRRKHWVK